MNPIFQNCFIDPDGRSPLKFRGGKTDGIWTSGELISEDETINFPVSNGIPSFAAEADDPWGSEEKVDALLAKNGATLKNLIKDNYEERLKDWGPNHKEFCWIKKISDFGGLVLEVACGWGGGSVPLLLQLDPNATIMLNDLGRVVLDEWRKYIKGTGIGPNVSMAHFDATKCPIRDSSFDIVDSSGGIANISASHLAIKEAYRMLKPGGRLFMADCDPDPESFARFPKEVQEQWRREHNDPDLGKGYEERLEKTGFKILSMNSNKYSLKPDESTLSELAVKHGFEMQVVGFSIEAIKP